MKHSILFTGHMIDKKDRKYPRFPANKEMTVRAEILKHLIEARETINKELTGIAGGACGGDILFHEICEEIGIHTEMYLALPIEEFKKNSVSFAGKEWDNRFDRLANRIPIHILPHNEDNITKNNIWEETNLWMLDHALQIGKEKLTLIAVWDGKSGDGNGGTEHMINTAKAKGSEITIINI